VGSWWDELLDGTDVMNGQALTRRRHPGESSPVETLILDLLEWLAPSPRPYAEVLEAWRTSCPGLAVWEDANDRGFVTRRRAPGGGVLVAVSAAGVEHLRVHGRRWPK
jgi:D-3-phosphoglycerate dehydrogenase